MAMNSTQTVTVALVLAVSGCSGPGSKRKPPEMRESFSTSVTEDGSKMFEYRLVAVRSSDNRDSMPSKGGMRPRGGMGGGKGGDRPSHGDGDSGAMQEKMKSKFYEKLDAKLAESGYCREGYMELDSTFSRGTSVLRGECRESASDTDRDKFSDKVAGNETC